MKLLLDTQLLLWATIFEERLSQKARTIISEPANKLFFSAASIWEVAIKKGLNRPGFDVDPKILRKTLQENGYEELPVFSSHAVVVADMPPIHKDPFDRLLIAQANYEGFTLLTADELVAKYSGAIQLV